MSGDFSVDVDRGRGLLNVRMWGFYTEADVTRYHAAVVAASADLGLAPSAQLMLNNISEMMIQSQVIVAAFQKVMGDKRYAGRRVGFVAASSLARTQLSRVIGSRTARIFATAAEAEAWLFDPAERGISAAA